MGNYSFSISSTESLYLRLRFFIVIYLREYIPFIYSTDTKMA